MKKILNVKNWLLHKTPQFKMIEDGQADRLIDGVIFSNNSSRTALIFYKGSKGSILEFMANYVHVQIEVKKDGVPDYEGMIFDSENYEVIEVPINDVRPRAMEQKFVSPGISVMEKDEKIGRVVWPMFKEINYE